MISITNKNFNKLCLIIRTNIDFQNFMNLYKKCTEKPFSFLVIDTALALDNPARFRKNLLERI